MWSEYKKFQTAAMEWLNAHILLRLKCSYCCHEVKQLSTIRKTIILERQIPVVFYEKKKAFSQMTGYPQYIPGGGGGEQKQFPFYRNPT